MKGWKLACFAFVVCPFISCINPKASAHLFATTSHFICLAFAILFVNICATLFVRVTSIATCSLLWFPIHN